MDKIIKEANFSKKQIEVLNKKEEKVNKDINEKITQLQNERNEKVYAIEDEYRDKINCLETTQREEQSLIKIEREKLYSVVKKLDRIFRLKEVVDNNNNKNLNIGLKNFEGRDVFIHDLNTRIKNQYIEINFYIRGTKKPTNKFALVMIGNSIFNNELINFPRDYMVTSGVSVECGEDKNHEDLAVVIKEAPTAELLKEWFDKRSSNLECFWDEEKLSEYKKLVEDYEWVKSNCDTDEWHKAYLEWKKEYYETNYSRYNEEKEYKKICKKLNDMTGNIK
jgi:hypothetical protein